jgi:ArsR family transcriptional regulator
MMKTAAQGRRVDRMFRAFSDRTRLRILHLLLDSGMCVGDLVAVLRVGQPSVSRHLAYLRKAGLVAVRKTRTWSYNSLAPATTPFHAKLLECLACCFEEVSEIQRDRVRARKVRERGGCRPDSTIAKPDKAEDPGGHRSHS